jgi:tRNA pseudouridine38-40 synthase
MRNLRLRIEYDGTEFHGFARQQGVRTVQGVLESVLTATLNEPIEVIGASRTDAGVHARGQVVNFYTSRPVPTARLATILNRRLPNDLKVLHAREVSERDSTRASRRKAASIATASTRGSTRRCGESAMPGICRARWTAGRCRRHCKRSWANTTFAPSRSKSRPSRTPVRTLYRGLVVPTRDGVQIELEANGFLRGMVRLIVGDLTQVGSGALPVDALAERLRTRQQATLMAPPQGLCLIRVKYRR